MSERIIVTGCAGFIGFHLSRRLMDEGYMVLGIDNLNEYYDVNLKKDRLKILQRYKGFSFFRKDLNNREEIWKIGKLENIGRDDRVVHLAAQAGVRYSSQNPESYIQSNLVGFFNLLELCKDNNIRHLVYASSSSVYGGNTKLPFSAHDNVDHPRSLYAATKKSNELLAHVYSSIHNLPTTGLRFFTVYGPWGRPDMSLFIFTKAILRDETMPVYNNGDMFRDFTYIDDIVEGIFRILFREPQPNPQFNTDNPDPASSWAPFRIYNIGNNKSIKLTDFIRVIEENLGKKAKIEFKPMIPGDVKATYADIEDIFNFVGFKPKTSIEKGIPKFLQWYREYYGE